MATARYPSRMPPTVRIDTKAKVTHPGGVINKARVVMQNGRAAVWVDGPAKTSTRVLFATDVVDFIKAPTRRIAHQIILGDGTIWSFTGVGGCSCGSPLKGVPAERLVEDDFYEVV